MAGIKSKWWSCPSRLDADGRRKILASNSCGTTSFGLGRAFSQINL